MSKELNLSHIAALNYDLFSLTGDIIVSSLIPITAELQRYVSASVPKDIVLDLSETNYIDSSGIRLILNIKKRIESKEKILYLLNPSTVVRDILTETNLTKVLTIIESSEELEKQMTENLFNAYLPYTNEENEQHRLNISCSICGSKNVVGYLIDQNRYSWKWIDDDPFPTALDIDTEEPFDFFSLLPNICLDCFFCSIKIRDFNIYSDGDIILKSTMHEESRMMLAKSIKKRKKLITIPVTPNDTHFNFPREKNTIYNAYQLAEFCTRSISVLKLDAFPFDIGYINYLAICYAESKAKEEHINSCRTWFTQTLTNASSLPIFEKSLSFFALLISNLNLGKIKDASQVYGEFTKFINQISSSVSTNGIVSPLFWYNQAEIIWKKNIDTKSSILKS